MQSLATFLIGYSIFSALVIALTHFRAENYSGQHLSRFAGIALLLILAVMQWLHFSYLQHAMDYLHGPTYRILLFTVAPMFYLFSKPLLQASPVFHPLYLLHFLPAIAAISLSYTAALPLAFAIGAGYLLWLLRTIYSLRAERRRFEMEVAFLGLVFVIAIAVSVLGLSLSWLGEQSFYLLYACAIGCAFLLVSLVLGMTPQLAREVVEVAQETYAVSTLKNVDCQATLAHLDALMQQEKRYRQATLDLATVAGQVGLSSHQLSELINTRLGKSFTRYLREYRVAAAQQMLLAEPSASVLSIGLDVGFTSQSNFYEAFREIAGMTPGKYRKLNSTTATE